jgi:hypothetical protein
VKKIRLFCTVGVFMCVLSLPSVIFSQVAAPQTGQLTNRPSNLASGRNLYCAGVIQRAPVSTATKIIGAQHEADRFTFSQNDLLVINMGRNSGLNVGDVLSVVRPRGAVKSSWSRKGDLGFLVQELGSVEVVDVKNEVSSVRVKHSCENFSLGDLVRPFDRRDPLVMTGQARTVDAIMERTGGAAGRVIMGRDNAEMMARDSIAYIDLGAEDNLRVGDMVTIFRRLDKGNLTRLPDRESASARDYGFPSDEYKGGRFSNQSMRKTGETAGGRELTTRSVRNDRPSGLSKVVGEAVVIRVAERTATVVITRNNQEVHTGDWVQRR